MKDSTKCWDVYPMTKIVCIRLAKAILEQRTDLWFRIAFLQRHFAI